MNQIVITKDHDDNVIWLGPGTVEIGSDGIIVKLHDIKDGDEYTMNKSEQHGDKAMKCGFDSDGVMLFRNMGLNKGPDLRIIEGGKVKYATAPTNKVNLRLV